VDILGFILGGLFYLLSPDFRAKKQQHWESQGLNAKIFDIGMWITTLLVIILLIVAIAALQVHD
jgi:multisubunit Na+/H+ antiporter MnhB subunit